MLVRFYLNFLAQIVIYKFVRPVQIFHLTLAHPTIGLSGVTTKMDR